MRLCQPMSKEAQTRGRGRVRGFLHREWKHFLVVVVFSGSTFQQRDKSYIL